MKIELAIIALVGMIVPLVNAVKIIEDFATFSKGNVISKIKNNVNIVAYKNEGSTSRPNYKIGQAMIFDSASPTGGDSDLGTPNQKYRVNGRAGPGVGRAGEAGNNANTVPLGRILIISEDNDFRDPDDNQNGGYFEITFPESYVIHRVGLLDNEEGIDFETWDESNKYAIRQAGISGDNGVQTFNFVDQALGPFRKLKITLKGSGAITFLEYEKASEATKAPTKRPTKAPTKRPTKAPTKRPTNAPTKRPTSAPLAAPVKGPTVSGDDRNGDGITSNCMEDNWKASGKNMNLVCTAKEVSLVNLKATVRSSCIIGQNLTLSLNGTVQFNTARYDPAWFIAKDGGDALTGKCFIQPLLKSNLTTVDIFSAVGSTTKVGQIEWTKDFKGTNDACGDVIMNTGGGGVLQSVDIAKDLTLVCDDKNRDGVLDIGICFSWREPGADDTCNIKSVYPGAPSKCFCTRYDIPQVTITTNDDPVDECY